jgi:hypothetical protein
MSLAFKPKIPDFFKASMRKEKVEEVKPKPKPKPKPAPTQKRRAKRAWTSEDLALLIELRALALPHTVCGAILKRKAADTAGAVHKHQLQKAIQVRRKILISEALNGR